MIRYSSDVTIDRAPEVVFPYLTEPALQAQWTDVPMRRLTEGPNAMGSRFEVAFGRGPLHLAVGLELTAVEPDRRLAWTTFTDGALRWEGEYLLEPVGSSTRLSQAGRLQFRGLWRLLEPIVGAEIRSGEVKELERLKALVEGT